MERKDIERLVKVEHCIEHMQVDISEIKTSVNRIEGNMEGYVRSSDVGVFYLHTETYLDKNFGVYFKKNMEEHINKKLSFANKSFDLLRNVCVALLAIWASAGIVQNIMDYISKQIGG